MTLNLLKLCVGCESVEDLEASIGRRLDDKKRAGEPVEYFHTTRMMPKRAEELVAGGSLYWIIKGMVQCRQRLLEVRPFTDAQGISRCRLVLEPQLVRTNDQPRRPFQGWRYLKGADAPADLPQGSGIEAMPRELRRELVDLGLL